MDERWQTIKRLFHEALARPTAAREAFLRLRCADDDALFETLTRLLAADDAPRAWVDGAVYDVAAPVLAEPATGTMIGRRIGVYSLVREIGRGGMGTVYLGRRDDREFEQQVAVKLLRHDGDRRGLRRFRQERQILASLDHPHIAQLLDGGLTDEGTPYVIMPFIEGQPIDVYCHDRSLDLEARLRLFRQVCAAVAFAHRHLVVHCDLKPSNILVTGDGVPMLVDFGIAKLLGTRHVPRVEATTVGAAAGMTPAYASPEQVLGQAITTATDVYALGMLLHRLLVGRLPYSVQGRRPSEIEDLICHRPPPLPSQATPEDAATVEHAWARRLAGDLDTIVLRALDKEPARRYPTVDELDDDLERYLRGLPVKARPDTWLYRTGKMVRRHRVAVTAAAMVVGSLATGVVVASWQAREADHQRRLAREQQAAAERVADFLADVIASANPFAAPSPDLRVRTLIDQGTASLDQLDDQPAVQARMLGTLGDAYRSLGLFAEAEPLLEQALAIRRQTDGPDSSAAAASLHSLGFLRLRTGDLAAAERLLRHALALRERHLGPQATEVADTLDRLGAVLRAQDDLEGARNLLRRALTIRRAQGDAYVGPLTETLNNLGLVDRLMGNHREAEAGYREALTLNSARLGEHHPAVGSNLHNLGGLLGHLGRYEEAEAVMRRAIAIYRQHLGDRHPTLATGLNTLAVVLRNRGDLTGAERHYREALAVQHQVLGDDHADVARTMANLASTLGALGRADEAETLYRRALAVSRQALGEDHRQVIQQLHQLGNLRRQQADLSGAAEIFRQALALRRDEPGTELLTATTVLGLGWALDELGRSDEAEPLLREGLALREQTLPSGHWRTASARGLLGGCLLRQGHTDEAERLLLGAWRTLRRDRGDAHPLTRSVRQRLESLYGSSERARPADLVADASS